MTTVILKKNIHKAVDEIEDTGLLRAVYAVPEKQIESSPEVVLKIVVRREDGKTIII